MNTKPIHQCQCDKCQQEGNHIERMLHHQINLVMSSLDEQQRRWYAAVEANRHSYKGVELVSQIGPDEKTIRRGPFGTAFSQPSFQHQNIQSHFWHINIVIRDSGIGGQNGPHPKF